MKEKERPRAALETRVFADLWVGESQLESLLSVCAGLSADLTFVSPSNSLSVTLMACPPSHSLDSFILLFERGQKKRLTGDKTQFCTSLSAFVFLRVLQFAAQPL